MAAKPGGYYAVRTGRVPGIYRTWAECEQQVLHFPNARYKRFNSEQEAQRFIAYDVHADNNSSSSSNNNSTPTQQQTISSPRQISLQSTTVPIGYTGSTTVVYTDGSCLSNGKGDGVAVAGIGVFFGDGDVRNLAEPLAGARQTNQRAEITAAIRALELLHGTRGDVEIRTDSHYVIKAMSEWIHNWIAKGWAGTQVENRDLFERLYHLISLRRPDQVRFVYVPGHSGEHGNTQADLLARVGAGNC